MAKAREFTCICSSSLGVCPDVAAEYMHNIRRLYRAFTAKYSNVFPPIDTSKDITDNADNTVSFSELGRRVRVRKYMNGAGSFLDPRMPLHVLITAKKMSSLGESSGSTSKPWESDVKMAIYLSRMAFFDDEYLIDSRIKPLMLQTCNLDFDFQGTIERVKVVVADFESEDKPAGDTQEARVPDPYDIVVSSWHTKVTDMQPVEMPSVLHITGGNTFYMYDVLKGIGIKKIRYGFQKWSETDHRFCVGQSAGGIFLANGNPLAAFAKGFHSFEAAGLVDISYNKNVLVSRLDITRQAIQAPDMDDKLLRIDGDGNPWATALGSLCNKANQLGASAFTDPAADYATTYTYNNKTFINLPRDYTFLFGDIVSYLSDKIIHQRVNCEVCIDGNANRREVLIFDSEPFLEVLNNSIVIPHLEPKVMMFTRRFCDKITKVKNTTSFLLEEGNGFVKFCLHHTGNQYSALKCAGNFTIYMPVDQNVFLTSADSDASPGFFVGLPDRITQPQQRADPPVGAPPAG